MTDVPAELAELRARISAVESRQDAEASLRAMVDLDLSTVSARLGAQHRLLVALAQTQSDHTQRLGRIEDRTQRIEDRTQRIEDRTQRLEAGTQRIEERTQRIEDRTERLEAGVQAILGLLGGGEPR